MRARVAYISSFGTTAILVAAALLMLALVGAIVAFQGWPGVSGNSGVTAVPLAPHTSATRAAFTKRPATHRLNRSIRVAAAARGSTAGLVKGAATGPAVVPGLVMVAAPSRAPMMHPSGGHSPLGQSPRPIPGGPQPPTADPVPPVPDPGTTLPGLSQVPPPDPNRPPPSSGDLSAMLGQLLASAPPPPGVAFDAVSRVVAGAR